MVGGPICWAIENGPVILIIATASSGRCLQALIWAYAREELRSEISGLIVADPYDAAIVREAAEQKMGAP